MTSRLDSDGATRAAAETGRSELLDRLAALTDSIAPTGLRARISGAVDGLSTQQVAAVAAVLDEVLDLEARTVSNVRGRDGAIVAVHHYRACRSEDRPDSWDHRPTNPPIAVLRRALMNSLLGPHGIDVQGVSGLAAAARAGKRFLFIANHESVFDLPVLSHALAASGLESLSDKLTFFVNPKIFNMPFINLFICKSLGLIKVPQSPRIAANESVMEPGKILSRSQHAFGVAAQRLAAGDSLAIYPEGLRSDGVLHRFARAYLDMLRPTNLAAVGLEPDDVLLVPWAHRGVRTLQAAATPVADVSVRFGEPVAPTRFFEVVGEHGAGVAGHLAGFLVAKLLPAEQRGVYGSAPQAFVGHRHYRLRIGDHTLAEIRAAERLAGGLSHR